MNEIRASLIPGRGGRWRGCAIFSRLFRSSHLLWSTVSRAVPLINKGKQKKASCQVRHTKDIARGLVIQTGLSWGLEMKLFFRYCGGTINMARILKPGPEMTFKKDGHRLWRRFSRLQLASLNMYNIQVWENLKFSYMITFSSRDLRPSSGQFPFTS